MYDLLKETEQTVTSHLSREPSDLDPSCFQKRFKGTNEHIAQVPLLLVYDQIFQISISKQSRPWSGSSHESCFISICIVYKNILKLQHEFIAQVPLVYDQIFRISISKQRRPWSGSSHRSRLICTILFTKKSKAATRAYRFHLCMIRHFISP